MIIRNYNREDINNLVPLFEDLGYPTSESALKSRLEPMFEDPHYNMFVVEENGELIGLCGYTFNRAFEVDGMVARVLSFVVHHNHRHKGVAKALMETMVAWAKDNNMTAVVLLSGIKESRYVAHAFYERFGFDKKSYGFSYTIK